jgi:formylglycine-generating enzyme required for sulfatase activity
MKTTAVCILTTLAVYCAASTYADTFSSGANTFDIEFVPIGNPNNPDDTTGDPNPAGKVEYAYRMGKYEISQVMIDKATASGMTNVTAGAWTAAQPAANITWHEAAAFVNWLNTSEGYHAAYDLTWDGTRWQMPLWNTADAWQLGGENLFRHKDAHYFLPSMDEWYKAAYYDPDAGVYYDYPTGSDSVPDGIDVVGDTLFDAVFRDGAINPEPNDITDVGILSPYGTAGQGGNVWEWEETESDLVNDSPTIDSSSSPRGDRGGRWALSSLDLLSSFRGVDFPSIESANIGFRVASVASIPEPSTAVLGAMASVGAILAGRRRPAIP